MGAARGKNWLKIDLPISSLMPTMCLPVFPTYPKILQTIIPEKTSGIMF
ncbi:hypothetical protein BH10CYA1_BH10CYA1_27840 [soil metagenome]